MSGVVAGNGLLGLYSPYILKDALSFSLVYKIPLTNHHHIWYGNHLRWPLHHALLLPSAAVLP